MKLVQFVTKKGCKDMIEKIDDKMLEWKLEMTT